MKKHQIPIFAIPCLNYRNGAKKEADCPKNGSNIETECSGLSTNERKEHQAKDTKSKPPIPADNGPKLDLNGIVYFHYNCICSLVSENNAGVFSLDQENRK